MLINLIEEMPRVPDGISRLNNEVLSIFSTSGNHTTKYKVDHTFLREKKQTISFETFQFDRILSNCIFFSVNQL